ncbi:hypothetical protein AQUCO_01700680v1 [Aquilegia coerulea]|uniref:Uncharacterized protein n=1 Tax=Aquilegia coerulea TaxID=218851 RepID=A0A2G5DPY4_AQUCA|nr:hypothetical protein AQUCO_01700680v1 [Aquilegia coerulea]
MKAYIRSNPLKFRLYRNDRSESARWIEIESVTVSAVHPTPPPFEEVTEVFFPSCSICLMEDNLFLGLPPPSAPPPPSPPPPPSVSEQPPKACNSTPAPVPILKSALKRKNPSENPTEAAASQKGVRFKTTVEASETQVIEAMRKIASHIKNPTKFNKASKLAVQLIQAGSVKPGTGDYFLAILEAAMSLATASSDPSLRAEYHSLFIAAQDVADVLSKKQRNQLTSWSIRAVVGTDLYTDDSFVFSKAAGRIKEIISSLPVATNDDDVEEAAVLSDENHAASADGQDQENVHSAASVQSIENAEFDPFGLDALLADRSKKDERPKGKKQALALSRKAEEEESKRFLRSQREAVIFCLEIAAGRYRVPWCQTVIDILVKHAFDNIERFTSQQRHAIQNLWVSVREQQTRRKQGKSANGKLDMNGFERLQEKYANEKMSIRHSVGGGTRRAEQWLG